jgi:hypothetical protein
MVIDEDKAEGMAFGFHYAKTHPKRMERNRERRSS